MAYITKKTSFFSLVWKTLKSSRGLCALFAVAIVIVIVNILASLRLKEYSASVLQMVKDRDRSSTELRSECVALIIAVIIHYSMSTMIEFLKSTIEIIMFHKSLRDAQAETLDLEYNEYHRRGLGKNQDNITRSSWAFSSAAVTLLIEIPNCILTFVLYTYTIAGFFHPHISAMYFAALFLCVLFAFSINVTVNRNERVCMRLYKNSLVHLVDSLTNYDVVKAYNRESHEIESYDKSLGSFTRQAKFYYSKKQVLAFLQKSTIMIPHFTIILLFIYGYDLKLPASKLLFYNNTFMSYKSNFISLRDFCFSLSKKLAELEPRLIRQVKEDKQGLAVMNFKESIELKNVDLHIGDYLVNKNLTFTVNRGDKIAITGFNGAGKSTFLKMMLRFQQHRGQLLIDGIPIEDIEEKSVRSLIGYVPQNNHIFNNTVLYNLGYAQEKFDEDEIYRLCKAYGYHEFFSALPGGYLTHAGENGNNLSGGQKQRINFMRAIIKGSPILILDEPTANLDKNSERELISSIFIHCADKTVFVIIHNTELLEQFEKILYFNREGVSIYNSHASFIEATC